MRLWSLHPKYLDARGLVALWREALLAQAVLRGETKGYRNHPQLERFRSQRDPVGAIGSYLAAIHDEATARGYHFDRGRIAVIGGRVRPTTTSGQLAYEFGHLLKKLRLRDPVRYRSLRSAKRILPNPLIVIVAGGIEPWERSS
ncbi:DNA lyase [bacterium]|nr:DNA lyase [bacterium]